MDNGDITSLPQAGWDVAEPLSAPVKDTALAPRANVPASCPRSVPRLHARASGAVVGDALSMGTVILRGLIAAMSPRKVKLQLEDSSAEGQTAMAFRRTVLLETQTASSRAVRLGRDFGIRCGAPLTFPFLMSLECWCFMSSVKGSCRGRGRSVVD